MFSRLFTQRTILNKRARHFRTSLRQQQEEDHSSSVSHKSPASTTIKLTVHLIFCSKIWYHMPWKEVSSVYQTAARCGDANGLLCSLKSQGHVKIEIAGRRRSDPGWHRNALTARGGPFCVCLQNSNFFVKLLNSLACFERDITLDRGLFGWLSTISFKVQKIKTLTTTTTPRTKYNRRA